MSAKERKAQHLQVCISFTVLTMHAYSGLREGRQQHCWPDALWWCWPQWYVRLMLALTVLMFLFPDIYVHSDGGRILAEEDTPAIHNEIPPTYESIGQR
jgi:hypothetical protein